MVKREKTPEAIEEAKYYTCWSPYPNNADFELSGDYIPFCHWIANILENKDALHSLYYKRGHGMVIFGVDKTYPRPERLLGEHRWKEFLKKTKDGESDLVSKIFYSTYTTHREVEKDAWTCIFVEDSFFSNYRIDKLFTKVPYPAPHWCDVPSESKVHKTLCRPIPRTQVSRPVPPVVLSRPVVGSASWTQTRASTTTNAQHGTPTNRGRGRGATTSTGKGAKTNKQTPDLTWGQKSFPALESKPPAPKQTIPGLSSPPATPIQSAWRSRQSGSDPAPSSPHRSALAPPDESTARANIGPSTSQPAAASPATSANSGIAPAAKTQNGQSSKPPNPVATTTTGKKGKTTTASSPNPGKSSSSSSSSQSEHSSTTSPLSSAPSSPSLSVASLASGSVSGPAQVDPSQYDGDDDDYDEELTNETYYENWETASTYVSYENDTIAVRLKGNVKSTPKAKAEATNAWPKDNGQPSSAAADRLAKPEPVKAEPQTNLWAQTKSNSRPTGRASAMEARAKTENEVLCPAHKGKCTRGICEEYKKAKKRFDKSRKKEKRKQKKQQKAKEDGRSEEDETEKVGQERKSTKKEQAKVEETKQEETKKEEIKKEETRKEEEEEEKEKEADAKAAVEDTVVTPTRSPPPNDVQGQKKQRADHSDDSDIGDISSSNRQKYHDDSDYEED